MNRKETISIAIVGMALLATVMTMSSPTQALALGHWNLDEDITPNSGLAEDSMDTLVLPITPMEKRKIVMKIALLQQRMMAKKMAQTRMTKKKNHLM